MEQAFVISKFQTQARLNISQGCVNMSGMMTTANGLKQAPRQKVVKVQITDTNDVRVQKRPTYHCVIQLVRGGGQVIAEIVNRAVST